MSVLSVRNPQNKMVECGSCGEIYPKKNLECPKCGSKSMILKESAHKECESCGTRNNLDASCCIKCNARI